MASGRYVERTGEEMQSLLEGIGFSEVDYEDEEYTRTMERVFFRPVITKSGKSFPYNVVVFTSVDRRHNKTREVASDAIRLVLKSTVTGRPVKRAESRVYRTKSALVNLQERAREMFRFVMDSENHCPSCSALMDIREVKSGNRKGSKFLGCTNYPTCRTTKPIS